MPAYVPGSEYQASTAGTAARTFDCAADFSARSLKPRYDGTAIASRMPRITMTTRSSMRVKPSSLASRCLIFETIAMNLLPGGEVTDPGIDLRRTSNSPERGIRRSCASPADGDFRLARKELTPAFAATHVDEEKFAQGRRDPCR